MKKLLALASVLGLVSLALADNVTRIQELKDENYQLANKVQQAQQYIQQMQIKIIGNTAIIQELTEQDKPKPEAKEEAKKE